MVRGNKIKKICVIGLGYIGLPTSALLSTSGFEVVGVDINLKLRLKRYGLLLDNSHDTGRYRIHAYYLGCGTTM